MANAIVDERFDAKSGPGHVVADVTPAPPCRNVCEPDDPLFRRANVPFADGPRRQQTEQTVNQLERLARTRFWNEAQTVIEQLYRRAFGK